MGGTAGAGGEPAGAGRGKKQLRQRQAWPRWVRQLLVFLLFCFVLVPAVVLAVAAVLGGILAAVEGWRYEDGFLYVISNLCALANPLTDVGPDSEAGMFFDILVALWSLAISGAAIGVVAALSFTEQLTKTIDGSEPELDGKQVEALVHAASKGAIDLAEFKTAMQSGQMPENVDDLFQSLDADGDGLLDAGEVEVARASFRRQDSLRSAASSGLPEGGVAQILEGLAALQREQRRLAARLDELGGARAEAGRGGGGPPRQ